MNKRQKEAMKHSNKLSAGARKRAKLSPAEKFEVVMAEFRRGTLHGGSGDIVVNPKQALAIAFSEKRKREKRKK